MDANQTTSGNDEPEQPIDLSDPEIAAAAAFDERLKEALTAGRSEDTVDGAATEFEDAVRLMRDVFDRRNTSDSAKACGQTLPLASIAGSDTAKMQDGADTSEITRFLPSRFVILGEVGRGSYGIVFKARDEHLRRDVAIKILRPELSIDRGLRNRFLQESRAAARLNHPCIVPVFEAQESRQVTWQVSELVDGRPLSEYLRGQPVAERTTAGLMRDLSDAVHHAHQFHVLHRDIKPDNILVSLPPGDTLEHATLRLTDFGLARITDLDSNMSQTGLLVGTPRYMAPEQLTGDVSQHGPATDVYSMGIVLFKMLAGKGPFQGSNNVMQRLANLEDDVPSVRSVQPTVSRDLATICAKCLEFNPSDRYASATELRDDLQRYLDDRPTLARPLPFHERLIRWTRNNRAVATTFATIVLSLAIVTSFVWHSRNVERAHSTQLIKALDEKKAAYLQATESEAQFRELSWSTGLQRAFELYEQGDLIGAMQSLDVIENSHPDAAQHVEFNLLRAELASQFRVLQQIGMPVYDVIAIPDSAKIAFGIGDGKLRVLDIVTKQSTDVAIGISDIHALAASHNGQRLAVGGSRNSLFGSQPVVVNLDDSTVKTGRTIGMSTIESLAFSPDDTKLATGYRYSDVLVESLAAEPSLPILRIKGERRNESVAWRPGTNEVISVLKKNTLVFSGSDGNSVHTIVRPNGFVQYRVLPDPRFMISASYSGGSVEVIRIQDGHAIQRLNGAQRRLKSLAVSDDGQWVAVGQIDGRVLVWNLAKPDRVSDQTDEEFFELFTTVRLHEGVVTGLAWTGERLITSGTDGRIAEFDVRSESARRQGWLHSVTTMNILGTTDQVLLGLRDGNVHCIPAGELEEMSQDGQCERSVDDPRWLVGSFDSQITAIGSSDDGSRIAVGAANGTVTVIDARDSSVIKTYSGPPESIPHRDSVRDTLFSPDANFVYWTGEYLLRGEPLTEAGQSITSLRRSTGSKMSMSPDHSRIGITGIFEGVAQYTTNDGTPVASIGAQGAGAVEYVADSVVTGEDDGMIRVYDANTGTQQRILTAHPSDVLELSMAADRCVGVSVDMLSGVVVWNRCSGVVYGSLNRTEVTDADLDYLRPSVILSRDGRWVVTLTDRFDESDDLATIRVYDIEASHK